MRLDAAPLPASPVPHSLLDEVETLPGALAELAHRFPDFEALILLDRAGVQRISLARLWQRARDVQAALAATQLPPGAGVLLILPTSLDLTAAYFGAMLAGGAPAILSTPFHRYADRRVYVAHVGPIVRLGKPHVVLCTDEVAEIFRTSETLSAERLAILTPSEVRPCGAPPPLVTPAPHDVAMIQYSSGSTGIPKGVLLTHRALLDNMRSTRAGL